MTESIEKSTGQVTLGLSEETHAKLVQLKEQGHFAEMRDAYRLAIAVAMRDGLIDPKENRRGKTYLNAGSLDPDGLLRDAIHEALPNEGSPYEVAERLGEAGVKALWEAVERGGLERVLRPLET
jgi:hypothetical protein